MSDYYVAQEMAFAPGISGEWPEIIKAPHTKHGRLKLLPKELCLKIDKLLEEYESATRR